MAATVRTRVRVTGASGPRGAAAADDTGWVSGAGRRAAEAGRGEVMNNARPLQHLADDERRGHHNPNPQG